MFLQPFVAIVIVNYNGFADTRECLCSLCNVKYSNLSIILVDNASTDGSLEMLRDEFTKVHFVRSEINLGFTGGNNLGLEKAYEYSPDYILLLNNDTIVSENLLDELTCYMDDNPNVGLAGPLTLYYDSDDIIAFAGGNLNRNTGIVKYLHKGNKRDNITARALYCTFIEGAALFIRTEVIKNIGGLNNLYFLTSEESELCVRITDLGYQLSVLTSCCIWHKVSRSMGAESELSNYFIFRNKLWFVKRNNHHPSLLDLIQFLKYYITSFYSYIFKKGNYGAAKGMIYGVFDFFMGVDGPGRYRNKLKA